MTKKNYIHPALEILPLGAMVALCGSGDVQEGLDVGGGENPWTGSRAPDRMPAY